MGSVNRVLNQREQINAWLAGWRACEARVGKLEAAVRTLTKRSLEIDDSLESVRKEVVTLRAAIERESARAIHLVLNVDSAVKDAARELRWHRLVFFGLLVSAVIVLVIR